MKSRKQSVTLRLARSLDLGQPPQPSMLRAWSPDARRWLTAMPRRRAGGAGRRQRRHAQYHTGQDKAIFAARHASYTRTRALHSTRWSGPTRNGLPIGAVALNSERDPVVKMHASAQEPPAQIRRIDQHFHADQEISFAWQESQFLI